MTRRLTTAYSTLEWSADGSLVTKTRPRGLIAGRRFRNELRVNLLSPDGVRTPALVDHDARARSLTFEAIDGEPLGPKYPEGLAESDIDELAGIASDLRPPPSRGQRLRRFSSVKRIHQAHDRGLLDRQEADRLIAVARRVHTRTTFAHGDLTARNVLRDQQGLVLIDWEWGGLYPDGYELAFLWYSLIDVPGGRARAEAHVTSDPTAFLLSALVIQLWHLQWWYVGPEHRPKHMATRDDLMARLLQ